MKRKGTKRWQKNSSTGFRQIDHSSLPLQKDNDKSNKMKRVAFLLVFLLVIGLGTGRTNSGVSTFCQDQQEELIPSEDSVSVDDMDPIFYEPEEDEQMSGEGSASSARLVVGIVVLVILLGLGFLFISRSRTNKKE